MRKLLAVFAIIAVVACISFWTASLSRMSTAIPGPKTGNPTMENLTDYLSKNGTSGALLIGRADRIVSEIYWTWERKSVDQRTLFDLGSVSKQFTGFLLLQLEFEKKLSVQSRVEDFLPETKDTHLGPLVIEDLLHMTSGLPHDESLLTKLKSQFLKRRWSPSEVIGELAKYESAFAPGSAFQYSNLGYVLLAQIIQRVEEKPFADVLRERIFTPFEMDQTYLQDSEQKSDFLARGHLLVFGRWLAMPAWNYSFLQGAGGIVSNIRDLWRWQQGLNRFFSLHPDLASRYFGTNSPFAYGYGWGSREGLASHGGETPGFCSYITRTASSVVILTLNSDFCASGPYQDAMSELAKTVARADLKHLDP